jgi:hypothetical protein
MSLLLMFISITGRLRMKQVKGKMREVGGIAVLLILKAAATGNSCSFS